MKSFKTKLAFTFFLINSLALFAFQKESKTLHKEIDVQPNALVEIENQFGNLTLSSWDQNKVVLDVQITVSGSNSKRVLEKLENITVLFDLDPAHIKAKTVIEDSWISNWFSQSKLHFTIDYTVKLPRTSHVDLKNDYGTLVLNALEGNAKIQCDYGKLIIGELLSPTNYLSFDYTSNSTIDTMKGGEIKADYSTFELDRGGEINLVADYTNAQFSYVEQLQFKNDYGKLIVDEAHTVLGSGDYLTLVIGSLSDHADLKQEFGALLIESISPTAKKIQIKAEYTGIKMNIDPNWAFDYRLTLEYATFKHNLPLQHQIIKEEASDKTYEGYHGRANSGNNIVIDSEFGGVKFNY